MKNSKLNIKLINGRTIKVSRTQGIATMLVAAAVGVFVVVRSLAATVPASFEVERGTVSAPAAVASETGASGSSAVRFGSAAPTPAPTPAPATAGIWMSRAEIMALPTSGAAWDKVRAAAYGSPGTVNLGDLNSTHDTNVLAMALVSTRLNDTALRDKTINELMTLPNSGFDRVLELSRNIQSYVFAADIIDLKSVSPAKDAQFRSFISSMLTKSLQGHSVPGGQSGSIAQTARDSANNWGNHARAAMAAITIYLGDTNQMALVAKYHKGWLGDRAAYSGLTFSGTTWHFDPNSKVGVNPKGASRNGYNMDGIQPEDLRRGSPDFTTNPASTGYVWEGLQGSTVASVILSRAGLVPINAVDNAILRAYTWAYTTYKTPAVSDDTWMPWVANKLFGGNFPTQAANPGKNMGWTDWTHAR